jgi:hypothetical protein
MEHFFHHNFSTYTGGTWPSPLPLEEVLLGVG